jgi:hypothetical protein
MPDPFDAFETTAELAAFVHRKFGEEGLRQCLAMLDDPHREFLQEDADELAAVGLSKAAAILAEVAAKSLPEAERCPYEEGSTNAKAWHSALERRQRRRQTERNSL